MPLQPMRPTFNWSLAPIFLFIAARCSAVNRLGMAKPAEANRVLCRNFLLEVMLLVNRLLVDWLLSYWVKATADGPQSTVMPQTIVVCNSCEFVSGGSCFPLATDIR